MLDAILPDIRAQLVERFVFNFRIPPEELERKLPCSWLRPQVVRGHAVASFCVLSLKDVSFAGGPEGLGLANLNCAYRFGVVDARTEAAAVYVHERNTSSRLASFITSLGFPGHHPLVDARICPEQEKRAWTIAVASGGAVQFSAVARAAKNTTSSLFHTVHEFAGFLAAGQRSYCPARQTAMLNVVDLLKADRDYEPLVVEDLTETFLPAWAQSRSVAFDSAFRTTGGSYVWKYRGQEPLQAGR